MLPVLIIAICNFSNLTFSVLCWLFVVSLFSMPVFCFKCEKLFSTQPNLNRHVREVHIDEKEKVDFTINYSYEAFSFKCLEGCDRSFKFNKDLRNHLKNAHNFETTNETLSFVKIDEFEDWLKKIEIKNNIKYSKHRGIKRNLDDTEIIYFNCSRSGKQKILSDDVRKRSLKVQGSSKMGQGCTSQIIVTKNINGQVKVDYFKEHYGHTPDLKHLNISEDCRKEIASKLRMGIAPQHILTTIREKIEKPLRRNDLITMKDIGNIKTSFNISLNDGQRHKDDVTSIELYIQECKMLGVDNPILYYKKQGQLDNDYSFQETDMCLIIMYPIQKELFRHFVGDIVCVDGTHGLNNYDFEMTTILILDEFREGFPVAFMFSNRKDQFVFEVFFKVVKEAVNMEVINTKTFMTDMATVYYNAWISVMGCPSTNHFFCAWHVDKAWQHNLAKISDVEKRSWVYKSLKHLQSLLDENQFEKEFSTFLNILYAEETTHEMYKYLKNNYFHNRQKWAYCYRKSRGINTNMFLESMHKVIKYWYLEGKKVKRLDRTLHSLQKYIRDKSVNRIIKLTKGKNSKQIQDIRKRHLNALSSDFEIIMEDNCYIFKTVDDGESYIVNKRSNTAVCCELKCCFCKICWHAFECTCLDYQIKHMICKHIHYIILKKCNPLQVENELLDDENSKVNTVLQNINKDTYPTCTSQFQNFESELERKKELVKNAALQLISNMESKSVSSEDCDFILKNLKVLNNIGGTISTQTSQSTGALFKTVSLFPANQKIEKQKFFSTKKKRKVTNTIISKPNSEEKSIIKDVLSESLFTSKDSEHDHAYTSLS